MVSNAKFYSGKALDIRYKVSFGVMVFVILGLVLMSTYPPLTIFCFFLVYALSGYVLWVWEYFKTINHNKISPK
jgi:CDP-diacylglycerol--serine O-phosphatidyltransferase